MRHPGLHRRGGSNAAGSCAKLEGFARGALGRLRSPKRGEVLSSSGKCAIEATHRKCGGWLNAGIRPRDHREGLLVVSLESWGDCVAARTRTCSLPAGTAALARRPDVFPVPGRAQSRSTRGAERRRLGGCRGWRAPE